MAKKKVTLRIESKTWAEIEDRAADERLPARTFAASILEHQLSLRDLTEDLMDVRARLIQLQHFQAELNKIPAARVDEVMRRAWAYLEDSDEDGEEDARTARGAEA